MGTTQTLTRRIAKGTFPEDQQWGFESLFDNNEVGVRYEIWDTSTLFQNAAGTTPVTAPGQPVGLVLDKSKNLVLGSELVTPETQSFTQLPTQMTASLTIDVSITGGKIRGTVASDGSSRRLDVLIPTVSGRTYLVTVAGESNFGVAANGWANTIGIGGQIAAGAFTQSYRVTSTSTSMTLRFYPRSATPSGTNQFAGDYVEFSSFSVREIAGNHATQVSSGARPTYGVVPNIQRRNLFVRSEEFGDAAWAKNETSVVGRVLVPTAVSATHYATQNVLDIAVGRRYTFSAIVKPSGYAGCTLNLGASRFYANFNLLTGTVISAAADGINWANGTAAITPLANGYFLVQMTGDCLVSSSVTYGARIGVNLSATHSGAVSQTYVGDGVSGLEVLSSQIEVGPVVTTYQRVGAAFEARRNLLANTGFNGAVSGSPGTAPTGWTRGGSPSGTQTYDPAKESIRIQTTSSRLDNRQSVALLANTTYIFSVIANVNITQNWNQIFHAVSVPSGATVTYRQDSGVSTTNGNVFVAVASNTILSITVAVGATAGNATFAMGCGISATATGDVEFWRPQLENGSSRTNYQRVGTTAFDITEQGAPTTHYLQFDGIDDWLSTSAIDFSGTDKVTVFAGVRKLSDAAVGMLCELSVGSGTGRFHVTAPQAASGNSFAFLSGGDTFKNPTLTGFASPVSAVLTCLGNIDGPLARISANGGTPSATGETQGTGNYGNHQFFIGRRAGTSFPFNGQLHALIARGVLSSTAEIRQAEKLIAKKTSLVTLS